jgi:hypothetical protein
MRKEIVVLGFLLILVGVAQAESRVYFLDLKYDRGGLSLLDVYVTGGQAPDNANQPEDGYRCDVLSDRGILYSFRFTIPLELSVMPPLDGGEPEPPVVLEEVEFSLTMPYYTEAKTIKLYDPQGVEKLSVDVSEFAEGGVNWDLVVATIVVVAVLGILFFKKR